MKRWLPTLLLFAACREDPAAKVTAPDPWIVARDAARISLERHCGQCHVSSYETALPGALLVFDLLDADWHQHLTISRADSMLLRIEQPLPPDGDQAMPAPDQEAIRSFLRLWRAQQPPS